MFFQDFSSSTEPVDDLINRTEIIDGFIKNPISLHASHILKKIKQVIPMFKGTEYENTFSQSVEMHLESMKLRRIHNERFFDLKVWNIKEKGIIKNYTKKLDDEIHRQIMGKIDNEFNNLF